jgi:hypothetical protein
MTSTTCSKCGAPGTGNFCQECGAALKPGFCTKCGAAMGSDTAFCPSCGVARGGAPPTAGSPQSNWAIPAGMLVIAVAISLVFLVRINNGGSTVGLPPQGLTTSAGAGTPPDLSQMTPRERFDRLYNRVMRATEQGDAATMQQFAPMAIAAYDMLEEVDADARYHAALLKLHGGDMPGSAALADSILAETPNHLFGFIIQGTLAKWQNDPAALARVQRDFLAAYDEEITAGRPEYDHHRPSIEGFLTEAQTGAGPGVAGSGG